MNNLRTPPKFLQKPSPLFLMVHLLHRLYGVDAPGSTDDGLQFVIRRVHFCAAISILLTTRCDNRRAVTNCLKGPAKRRCTLYKSVVLAVDSQQNQTTYYSVCASSDVGSDGSWRRRDSPRTAVALMSSVSRQFS